MFYLLEGFHENRNQLVDFLLLDDERRSQIEKIPLNSVDTARRRVDEKTFVKSPAYYFLDELTATRKRLLLLTVRDDLDSRQKAPSPNVTHEWKPGEVLELF
jgi:hypothetical protein